MSRNHNGSRRGRFRVFVPDRRKAEIAARLGVHLVAAFRNVAERCEYRSDFCEGDQGIEASHKDLDWGPWTTGGPGVIWIGLQVARRIDQLGFGEVKVDVDVAEFPAVRQPWI